MKSLYHQAMFHNMRNSPKKIFLFALLAGTVTISSIVTLVNHKQVSPKVSSGSFPFPDEIPDFNEYITMHYSTSIEMQIDIKSPSCSAVGDVAMEQVI